jgi:hypothetical protein
MANSFQFIGKISRRKENSFVEKKFDSGWLINELNLIMTCGDNVQFLRASGGMWDEKHSNKNSVMTYKYNENGKDEPITVAWADRFDKNIIDSIANYRTYSVDTETKEAREEIKNSGDEAAIEKSNKKHKIFITAIDFVQWLNRVTSDEKTKDWVWKVTGDVEYSYSNGQFYRNFVPRRVYHVDPKTEQQCVGTIKTFYSEDCIEETDNDFIFNVYTQYYDSQYKKNCFCDIPLVIDKNHEKAKGLKRQYSKAEDDAVRELSVNVQYINGAQKVEISMEHLSDTQLEMIEDGLVTLEEIQRDMGGSVYGDKKTEIRITDLARGYVSSGSKETVFEKHDLAKIPSNDNSKTETIEDNDVPFDLDEDDI